MQAGRRRLMASQHNNGCRRALHAAVTAAAAAAAAAAAPVACTCCRCRSCCLHLLPLNRIPALTPSP